MEILNSYRIKRTSSSSYRYLCFVFFGIFLSGFLQFGCKKASAENEYQNKVNAIQEKYKAQIQSHYEIANSHSTKESAILEFLREISQKPDSWVNLCNEKETKEIFLPNNYNSGTITSMQDPEEAWNTLKIRREIALETLRRNLSGKEVQSISVQWKKERDLNSLKGHIPGPVKVITSNGEVDIEEIKLVIEHKSQFKVCIISR